MGNFGVRPLCRKWVIRDSKGHQERGTDPGSSSIPELACGTDNLPPRCPPRLLSRYTFEAPDYLGDFGKRTTPFRDCTPKCLVVAGGPKITLILEQGTSTPPFGLVSGDTLVKSRLDRAYQEHSNILLGRVGLAQEYFGDVPYERASSGVVPLSQHVRVVTAA